MLIDMAKRALIFLISIFCVLSFTVNGQDPLRFKKEVKEIKTRDSLVNKKRVILFTGSSSIRMWADIKDRFPEYNIVNTGFGGSQMSELFYYTDELIIQYHPKKIFIYEGDNDLGEGKSDEKILSDSEKVLKLIRCELPRKVKVYFITPKPSIRRWELKTNYEGFITKLKAWTGKNKNVYCVDVWKPMLENNGDLMKDLFLEDGLHMNTKGYDIWTHAITPYIKKK